MENKKKKICLILNIIIICFLIENSILKVKAQHFWAGAPRAKQNSLIRKSPIQGKIIKENSSPILEGICGIPALNPCNPQASCMPSVPIIGEAICQCPDGFSGDGRKDGTGCVNIDECRSGSHDCDLKTMDCIDLQGGYECRCKPGYDSSPSGKVCLDINECYDSSLNTCDQKTMTCRNLEGSYQCDCLEPNMVMDENTKVCRDLNECSDMNGAMNPCQQICINRNPGVECACQPGFKLENDKRSCEDINECLDPSLHTCDPIGRVSKCINTIGGHYCECNNNLGFKNTEDGYSCGNFNECEAFPYICGGSRSCCKDLAPPERFACIIPSDANLEAISSEIRDAGGLIMPFGDMTGVISESIDTISPFFGMSVDNNLNNKQEVYLQHNDENKIDSKNQKLLSNIKDDKNKSESILEKNYENKITDINSELKNYQYIVANKIDLKKFEEIMENKNLQENQLRRLQLLPSIFSSGHLQTNRVRNSAGGNSSGGLNNLRGIRGNICPQGFTLGADLQRSRTRKAAMQAVQTALFSNSRDAYGEQKPVNPEELTDSIVKNVGVVSKELQKWISELSSVPQEVMKAADPISNPISPQRQSVTLGEYPLARGIIPGLDMEALADLLIGGGIGKLIECNPANDPFCDRTGRSKKQAYGFG